MRPLDPRLVREARAARTFLAGAVACGLAMTALVLAQAGLLAHVIAHASQGIRALWVSLAVLAATLVLYGAVWLFTKRTRFGSVIRAVAEDPKLAELFGINAKIVYLLVFVFECSAVALGAALVAPRSPILTSMGFNEVIMTFVVVVLGGIGSIGGALVAGLGLGLFIAFFGAFIAQAYTTAAAFAVLLALLVIRPAGLATK